jgi:hypothetical protein
VTESETKIEAVELSLIEQPISFLFGRSHGRRDPMQVRIKNALHWNVKTIGDLVQLTEREFSKLRWIGRKSVKVTRELLAEHGLAFRVDDEAQRRVTVAREACQAETFNFKLFEPLRVVMLEDAGGFVNATFEDNAERTLIVALDEAIGKTLTIGAVVRFSLLVEKT